MAVRLGVWLGQIRLIQVRLSVHVWQLGQVLGQVYMYGSQVRCQVRLSQVRLSQARLGVHVWQLGVRLSQLYMYGSQVRCQVRGQVRCTCMAVRSGQVRCTCMNRNRNCWNFQNMLSKKVLSSFRWINLYHKSAQI